jgi:hypothetical protein
MTTSTATGLAGVRAGLAAVLAPLADTARGPELAATIYPEPTSAPTLPAVVLEAAEPWLAADYLGGTHTVRYELRLVTRSLLTGGSFTNLEQLVSDVLELVVGHYNVENVSSPFPSKAGDQAALACRFTVSVAAQLSGG